MKNFNFSALLATRFLYTVAIQIQAVVLGWQMYILTHDPLFLGLVGLAEAIPALGFALFSGYIVDRRHPLLVLRVVMFLGLLSGVILWVAHSPWVTLSLQEHIWVLFISAFLTGVVRSFFHPAIFAIVPRILPREQLSRGSAWMTSSFVVAHISGSALGGILFGWVGIRTTSFFLSITVLCALLAVFLVRMFPHINKVKLNSNPLRKELFLGAIFVFKHPILLPALSLDMLSVLFGGVTALLPVYASEILFLGPKGLGLLRAAPALGAAIVSLCLTRIELHRHAGRWLLWAVSGFGLSILVFSVSRNVALSFLALGLSGAFDSVSAVIRSAVVQLSSKEEIRGRISAINMIFISSSNELGAFESGLAARLMGTMPSVVFGGCVCLLTVGLIAILCPKLRQLDMNDLISPSQT